MAQLALFVACMVTTRRQQARAEAIAAEPRSPAPA